MMTDPEHARAEVCLWGRMVEEQAGFAPEFGRIERIGHDQEDVQL
jgi:hypothetical protein